MNKELFNQEGRISGSFNMEPDKLDPIYGHDIPCQNERKQIGALITQETIDTISEQIGLKVIQSVAAYLSSQKSEVKNRTSDSDNTILSYLRELYKDAVYDDKSTGKRVFSNHLIISNQGKTLSMIDNLNNQVNQLTALIESQNATIAEQASIIKKQHEAIARFESDVIYKTQKDLIMELIGIADQLRMTLNDYSADKGLDLHDAMEQLEEWVDGSLQAVAVRKYVDMESNELDRKRQEIVEIQETSNPEEDGLLKSILPGYVWSVPMVGSNEMLQAEDRPKKFEFMIRPEQMARLQYVKPDDGISGDHTTLANNREDSNSDVSDESLSDKESAGNSEIQESSGQDKPIKSKKDSWFKWS